MGAHQPLGNNPFRKGIAIFTLVLAGEMIFSLPFHIARFFRPTFLEVFHLSNTELGDAFAIYGITAMAAYFPGGPLADRFSVRKLITFSLLATGIGGIYMAQIPGIVGIKLTFGFWGVTTIFLFWAAMIKATREWGGKLKQGMAFGILDGGRGLVAAGFASLAVVILDIILGNTNAVDLTTQRVFGMKTIIYFYSFLTVLVAFICWLFIPEYTNRSKTKKTNTLHGLKKVASKKTTWLLSVVIVCAYCGYKGLDYYSLYVNQVLGLSEVEAARFVSNSSYLRAIAAIGAGLIADRFSSVKVIRIVFLALVIFYFIQSVLIPGPSVKLIIVINIVFTFAAVFALRGVYFAVLEESGTDRKYTGTAVGIISFIGFTPDIFFHPLTGRILDASPGSQGFSHYFLLLTGVAIAGLITSFFIQSGKLGKSNIRSAD